MNQVKPRILYCRCAFAQAVPQQTKDEVLERLCASGESFETVADLCEMAARKDPRLHALLEGEEPVQVVACFPRAVKWLFHSAGADFPQDRVEVLNMREASTDEICDRLFPEKIEISQSPTS